MNAPLLRAPLCGANKIMMNIVRMPIIRTLSLGDVMEVGDEEEEGVNGAREVEEEEVNIRLPSLYLPNQLDNEKVNLDF